MRHSAIHRRLPSLNISYTFTSSDNHRVSAERIFRLIPISAQRCNREITFCSKPRELKLSHDEKQFLSTCIQISIDVAQYHVHVPLHACSSAGAARASTMQHVMIACTYIRMSYYYIILYNNVWGHACTSHAKSRDRDVAYALCRILLWRPERRS